MSKKLSIIIVLTDGEKPYEGFERREFTLQRTGLESSDMFDIGKHWVTGELETMNKDIIF